MTSHFKQKINLLGLWSVHYSVQSQKDTRCSEDVAGLCTVTLCYSKVTDWLAVVWRQQLTNSHCKG